MQEAKVEALGDHVVVRAWQDENTTESGIVLNAPVEGMRPDRGTVMAVGPGRVLENGEIAQPMVSQGEHVLFHRGSAVQVQFGPEMFYAVRASDLIARVVPTGR